MGVGIEPAEGEAPLRGGVCVVTEREVHTGRLGGASSMQFSHTTRLQAPHGIRGETGFSHSARRLTDGIDSPSWRDRFRFAEGKSLNLCDSNTETANR
jgi:hypothetical protein